MWSSTDVWTYLLDTNVLSEPTKPRPDPGLTAWAQSAVPEECCLSVLSLAEIMRGLERLESRGITAKAARLRVWMAQVQEDYDDRILPITSAVAQAWAGLPVSRTLPDFDSLLAATAVVHGLTVVTRNVKDFEGTGVPCLDPFTGPG
ncbi:MAG: type II toxin-antitoxin system VapC family toxin [Cellulomonas sp.]|jgi:predicted nucleic acid-binding protein|nr:type II toxin-antitoxin system VapC family toxin [Cellulomonas sp.]